MSSPHTPSTQRGHVTKEWQEHSEGTVSLHDIAYMPVAADGFGNTYDDRRQRWTFDWLTVIVKGAGTIQFFEVDALGVSAQLSEIMYLDDVSSPLSIPINWVPSAERDVAYTTVMDAGAGTFDIDVSLHGFLTRGGFTTYLPVDP
jgi:hypothetical protein